MMKRNALLIIAWTALTSAAVAGLAHADMWPHRKPGLWQMTMTMQGGPMPPMTSRYCVDAATESALISAGRNASNRMCSDATIHVTGSTGTIDATCKFGSMTSTSHTVITFLGNTAYHSETRTHMTPPSRFIKSDHLMTNDAKWVGPCPAAMRPGDVVMSNGTHMHLDPKALQMRMPGGQGANP